MTTAELLDRIAQVVGRHADVRFALLFGSAAKKGPDAARDIDVAVRFARSPSWMEMARLAGRIEDEIGRDVDLVDVDAATTLLRWEIVRTGLAVPVGDAEALTCFRARVPLEYFDLEPFLEREAAGLNRRLGVTP